MSHGVALDIDLVIAVHADDRPVERAVASALNATTRCSVRVTVVCHNISRDRILPRLSAFSNDSRVRVIEHSDGLQSPAGPFNAGLEQATARYVSIMGSDDSLEPGALDWWLRYASRKEKQGADIVIARVAHAGRRTVPTPPVRFMRERRLDLVKDRLSYRTAPLGLVNRARFGHLRLTEGLRTGEDIEYGLSLWSVGENIVFAKKGPRYLIHDDAAERVTTAFGPVQDDLGFVDSLLESPALTALTEAQRLAFLTKIVRGSVLSLVTNRMRIEHWCNSELATVSKVAQRFIRAADSRSTRAAEAFPALSRAEARLLEVMAQADSDSNAPQLLLEAAASTRNRFTLSSLLPANLRYVLRADAPLRFNMASVLLMLS